MIVRTAPPWTSGRLDCGDLAVRNGRTLLWGDLRLLLLPYAPAIPDPGEN